MADLSRFGVTSLARLTHSSENKNDDITFLCIQSEIESRPGAERNLYRQEYLRIWKESMEASRG